jgi:anaerobic ribonucleoside-triphosphate reductase
MGAVEPQGVVSGQIRDEELKKRTPSAVPRHLERETTDMALFVRTSSEMLSDWNRQRIVDALLRETNIDQDSAEKISREVEEQILSSKISLVTAPLVRELVDAKLIEYGLEEARKMHTRLGVPLYDVDQLIPTPTGKTPTSPTAPRPPT